MSTYVGIDVGSEKHAVYAIEKEEDDPVYKTTITNDKDGFGELEKFLSTCGENIHLGLEATGSYWKPVFDYLMGLREKLDITLSLINPNEIHQFKRMKLSKVKTDSADAKAIARYVLRFKPQSTPRTNKRLRSLRRLCRYRSSRVEEKTRLIQQLDHVLVGVFPEYSEIFGKLSAVSSLAILREYPGPKEIAKLEVDELASLCYGKINHKLGEVKAKKLIDLAKNTVGEGYGPEIEITIRHLAQQLSSVKREVENLDNRIEDSFKEIAPNKLTTIDGIGPVNAAVMTTEIWDVNRFATATKLNGYVGAYPELSESGNYEDPHPDMTKKGNPRLKCAVFTSTMSAVTCNPVIKRHYEKQLAKGKDRMVALGSCMRKLVHIIYGILTSGEEFDPNYEQERSEKEEGRTRKPQSGRYPEDERSSESSPKTNNGEKIPNYQLAGGET
ncbi:IS110 family transposase [Candidatus Bipolaricaulota bacterium]|nr:IS110 family transposase [Candidatus Bipolaricaulota bacterium]